MNKEELKERIDFLDEEVNKIWHESFSRPDGAEWYKNHPTLKEYIETNREYKLVQDYELRDMDLLDRECQVSFDKFVDWCEYLCSSDGCGVYATKDKVSNIYISPNDVREGKYRKDFDYVCWYNK